MNDATTEGTPQVEAAAAETERRKKVKVNMDIPASCERMENLLDEARRVASIAIDIGGWTHLSAAVGKLRSLLRPKPGTLAWEQEIGHYLGHDPHLRWDAAPTPSGVDGMEIETPSGEGGGKPWNVCDIESIPEIGLEFKSVHTKTYHKYLCYWHSVGTSDEHIYEVTVQADAPDNWRTIALNDGREIFALYSNSKRNAIELGLAAMRRYLIRGHRRAWRTYRKTRAGAHPSLPANQPIN